MSFHSHSVTFVMSTKQCDMITISSREFRANQKEYLDKVSRGIDLLVTRKKWCFQDNKSIERWYTVEQRNILGAAGRCHCRCQKRQHLQDERQRNTWRIYGKDEKRRICFALKHQQLYFQLPLKSTFRHPRTPFFVTKRPTLSLPIPYHQPLPTPSLTPHYAFIGILTHWKNIVLFYKSPFLVIA